jgi:flagellar biosynthetic protein FliQ
VSDADVTSIAVQTMVLAAKVAAPILLTALVVGFAISLFQSVTQIQEQTLSFVPKVAAVGVAILITGNWMLHSLEAFTQEMFLRVPDLLS